MKKPSRWLGRLLIVGSLLCATTGQAATQVNIGVSIPGVSIGINMPSYPQFERVPDYPVYYAPRASINYFFYDQLYWVYQEDRWYSSSWYDGPWYGVEPQAVPLYVLRIPVRYYRQPPAYFRGWQRDEPPRWGQHWGREWERERAGWDQWQRRAAPPPAPLPRYQRDYGGTRYPRAEQEQQQLRERYERREGRDGREDRVGPDRQDRQDRRNRQDPPPAARGTMPGPQGAPADGRTRGFDRDKDKGHDKGRDNGQGRAGDDAEQAAPGRRK